MRHVQWIASIGSALALWGCTAEVSTTDEAGALSVALRQTDASGDVYRLRAAVLDLSGPREDTFEPAETDELLQTELPPGEYALRLVDGWQMERERGGQREAVAATLRSENPLPFTIRTDELTNLSLRFAVDGEDMVDVGFGQLTVQLEVEETAVASVPCTPRLVINEVDYNQDGPDAAEFIELYNAGACDQPTAGLNLVLRNGFASPAAAYAEVALDAAGPAIPAGGLVVVGAPTVLAALPAGVLRVDLGGIAIQNGDPDAIEVEQAGQILDSMSYGGLVPGFTEGSSAPVDRGAGSLQRCPSGADTDDNSVDFRAEATITPGAANGCS
jgi:hypothetical protein